MKRKPNSSLQGSLSHMALWDYSRQLLISRDGHPVSAMLQLSDQVCHRKGDSRTNLRGMSVLHRAFMPLDHEGELAGSIPHRTQSSHDAEYQKCEALVLQSCKVGLCMLAILSLASIDALRQRGR